MTATSTIYNYYRDYDPATGRYVQSDPMTVREHALLESIIPAMMQRNGKSAIGSKLELNPYAYVVNNPVSRIDPTGADEEGGKGGGEGDDPGDGFRCPLRAQFLLAFMPKYDTKIWYCIYDCNTSCPGSPDKIKTHIEFDVGTSDGCPEDWPPKSIWQPSWWKK